MERVLITICGRAGSKGFANKNLKTFCGQPLVYYTIAAALLFKEARPDLAVDIALNTDSQPLADLVAARYPEVAFLPRPAELGGDSVPKMAVFQNSLCRMEERKGKRYDYIIDLDITSPLRTEQDIENALAAIRRVIDADATIITAGGSLPSCMQRMWTTDKRGGYHAEYGYSCMGYEVAATLGVKFAEPDNEVYCVVGDSSFQMLHSEIMTIQQERQKVNILIFDNCGFGCINNLEMNHGIGSLATEFRYTDGKKPCGDLIPVDYAKIGEGYGLKTYTCKTIAELEAALADAKKQTVACLFDLKVIPKTMTDGYESWWNVGLADVSEKESVRKAWEGVKAGRDEARKY